MASKTTDIINFGRTPSKQYGMVNTPIYKSSTILFNSLEEYHQANKGKNSYDLNFISSDPSYGIGGTPTTQELQNLISKLEEMDHSLIYPSGLNAITMTLTSFLGNGDHILITESIYGPTKRFCEKILKKNNIQVSYYDPLIKEEICDLIQDNTKVIMLESPGSLTFEIQDIPLITSIAKKHNITTILDNSWATPLFLNGKSLGVDIVIHAGTKYFSGHSDILLGTASFMKKDLSKMISSYKNYGVSVSPEDCYLALRGLRTLDARLKKHQSSTEIIIDYLKTEDKVKTILHPSISSHPNHDIFKRDFSGFTGLLTIELDKKYSFDSLSNFIDNLQFFGIGASWGGFESLALDVDLSHRNSNYSNSLVRLYIGLEDPIDLITDLQKGFERL